MNRVNQACGVSDQDYTVADHVVQWSPSRVPPGASIQQKRAFKLWSKHNMVIELLFRVGELSSHDNAQAHVDFGSALRKNPRVTARRDVPVKIDLAVLRVLVLLLELPNLAVAGFHVLVVDLTVNIHILRKLVPHNSHEPARIHDDLALQRDSLTRGASDFGARHEPLL